MLKLTPGNWEGNCLIERAKNAKIVRNCSLSLDQNHTINFTKLHLGRIIQK
jgi:hypothetical protein